MAAMPAPVATRARGVPGRRPRLGVARPPCPRGHVGQVLLDGHTRSRQRRTRRSRHGIGTARRYRSRRAVYAAQRAAAGLPPAPQGLPRQVQANGSVAGKTVADFPWLVAQFHPTMNGSLRPHEIPAGTGNLVWWKCDRGPDHEWQAQVRSRTIRGYRCPFCTNHRVAPSGSFATTHADIAAEWRALRTQALAAQRADCGTDRRCWRGRPAPTKRASPDERGAARGQRRSA